MQARAIWYDCFSLAENKVSGEAPCLRSVLSTNCASKALNPCKMLSLNWASSMC